MPQKLCHSNDGRPTAPPSYVFCRECLLRIGKGDTPYRLTAKDRAVRALVRTLAGMLGLREAFDAEERRQATMSDAERMRSLREKLDEVRGRLDE